MVPWENEPDHVDFEHAGMPCIIHRVDTHGALCGYVGVPPGHPAHGKGYDDVAVEVHGGLTYASECSGDICHVPKAGEPEDVWWLGFDCIHAFDMAPKFNLEGTYRDIGYVRAETEKLAEQLAAMAD